MQRAQLSTAERFTELQTANSRLQREASHLRQQLTKIAEEREAAAAAERKRLAARVKRRPEPSKAFKASQQWPLCHSNMNE